MKGLELSERFYLEYGAPMIHEKFPELEHVLAVGLMGSGSECFGYDDKISQDHDFEPGFCIFIPDEDIVDSRTEFALERAYSKLPKEFMGYERNLFNPVGGSRHGVIRISKFISEKTGTVDGNMSIGGWFSVSEQLLAEATNGKVFRDDYGELTSIRKKLSYLPKDVRLKKLAGNLLIMGQAGQYNYNRCISRGESGAAQLALAEFVKSTLNTIFLLNKHYIPYYKWSFRALRELPRLSELDTSLEYLISQGNSAQEVIIKQQIIEQICLSVFDELKDCKITDFTGTAAEGHAYSINNKISNADIRNLHILYGV